MRPGLRFVAANEFLNTFAAFRILWIAGRFGGGKTSLAVMLAAWLLASGKVDRVVSNLGTVLDSPVTVPLTRAAIILDESWIYVDDRASVTRYAAFVRKFEHYLLLPSVWPPHMRLSFLSVDRWFNGYVIGVPVWIYRWQLGMRTTRERGYFGILNPSAIFGTYDTARVPGDDGGISAAIEATARKAGFTGAGAARKGASDELSAIVDATQTMEDTAAATQAAVDDIRRASSRLRR